MRPVSSIVRQAQEQLGVFPFHGYDCRFQHYHHDWIVYSLHAKNEVYVGQSQCVGSRIPQHIANFNGNGERPQPLYESLRQLGIKNFAEEVEIKIHFVPKGKTVDQFEREMINKIGTLNIHLMEAA